MSSTARSAITVLSVLPISLRVLKPMAMPAMTISRGPGIRHRSSRPARSDQPMMTTIAMRIDGVIGRSHQASAPEKRKCLSPAMGGSQLIDVQVQLAAGVAGAHA